MANTEQSWLAPHHKSLINLKYLPQPQAKCLTGKSMHYCTRQLMPKQESRLASLSAAHQRAKRIPKNPVSGARQEQQPSKWLMPSPCWVPAGRAVPQGCMEVSSGIGMHGASAACPPARVGWETPQVTPRRPLFVVFCWLCWDRAVQQGGCMFMLGHSSTRQFDHSCAPGTDEHKV